MKFNVENGWRGPLPGIARFCAIAPRGDTATIIIPRSAIIAQPKVGGIIEHAGVRYVVDALAVPAQDLVLSCRIEPDG